MSKQDFNNVIEEKIKNASATFSLAIIDIDNFEAVNNYYGEAVGDNVIKKVASVLKQNLRTNDYVGRYNKDEFRVLFSNTNAETGYIMVEEIRRYFDEKTFELGDRKRDIGLKISAGVANFPRDAKNGIELFRAAGSALFKAKKEGKNRVCLAESENMLLKSNYYTKTQLERLGELSKKTDKTEAFLLREALDDLFEKYSK